MSESHERVFADISLNEALSLKSGHEHAAHCMYYCRSTWKGHACRYVLMQWRSDGLLGFTGGLVDVDDVDDVQHLVDAVNREAGEEVNFTDSVVGANDYVFSHVTAQSRRKPGKCVSHFFAKEISEKAFNDIENQYTKAMHFKEEVLGLIRIPVLDDANNVRYEKLMGNFLSNKFAGNAREQLLSALVLITGRDTELRN
ncbi:U8 snoRNA-decapping enzyme [Halotydeus destructor]|nr:U8 snoRNA-decapping enzyme [Halotydeus destructor]